MARYYGTDLDVEVKHESNLMEPGRVLELGSSGVSLCGVKIFDQIRLDFTFGVGPVISTLPDCPFCVEINKGLL